MSRATKSPGLLIGMTASFPVRLLRNGGGLVVGVFILTPSVWVLIGACMASTSYHHWHERRKNKGVNGSRAK